MAQSQWMRFAKDRKSLMFLHYLRPACRKDVVISARTKRIPCPPARCFAHLWPDWRRNSARRGARRCSPHQALKKRPLEPAVSDARLWQQGRDCVTVGRGLAREGRGEG